MRFGQGSHHAGYTLKFGLIAHVFQVKRHNFIPGHFALDEKKVHSLVTGTGTWKPHVGV